MLVIKKIRGLVFFSIFILAACATPAHKNTWYTDFDTQSVLVRVYSPDTYELDGFMVNGKGLALQIKTLTESHTLTRLLIEPKADASLIDQAVALHIGETNGLRTFRISWLGSEEISSEQLLAQRDEAYTFDVMSLFNEI